MVSIAASFSSLICTGHIVGTTTSSPSLFTRLRSTRVGGSLTTSSQKLPVVLVRASVEEETLPPEVADQPVSVPVSPSDVLTMFFQAEGTMNETAIPTVTKALELTKQTTVQATGVASSLIETIQGSGFKLQTLNLSFEDKDEVVN
uniref:Uncharacterized protein n=1 Tax=Kalanchoe fedtschenkoi TaxID=63787 RepID=A0A7N0UND6_KALFE